MTIPFKGSFESPQRNSALSQRNSVKLAMICYAKFRKERAKFRKGINLIVNLL
jgi:hypothetical protein